MFQPVNRYILIEKIEKQKKPTTGLLLPEDYKPKQELYSCYKALNSADDVRFPVGKNCHVVVDNKMIEEISVNNVTYFVVQDNYVVGIFEELGQ